MKSGNEKAVLCKAANVIEIVDARGRDGKERDWWPDGGYLDVQSGFSH
jgi:hypothetical protein